MVQIVLPSPPPFPLTLTNPFLHSRVTCSHTGQIIQRKKRKFYCFLIILGSKGWRSGESTRLPPMWPGFKSRRRRHMWVEFVVGSLLCSERFFSGYSGFPLSSKTNISKFQFDQESGRRRTTMRMCYLLNRYLVI